MEPKLLHAGDSVAWSRELPSYPVDAGWSVRYVFSGPDRHVVEAHGGPLYRVELGAEQTRDWAAGLYRWVLLAQNGTQRVTVATGEIQVDPNLETAEPSDARSHAQRMLALIEAALERRIPKDQQSYEIDGMRLDRIPIERLEALRSKYQREIQRARGRQWRTGRPVRLVMR